MRNELTFDELSNAISQRSVRILMIQALAEGMGVEISKRLSKNPYLDPEDRDFARDILHRDEADHLKWALRAARYLSSARRCQYGAWQRRCNETFLEPLRARAPDGPSYVRSVKNLLRLLRAERFMFHFMVPYKDVLYTILPEDIAIGFEKIRIDEERHIAWGRSVFKRLKQNRPDLLEDAPSYLSLRNTPTHWGSREVRRLISDLEQV